MTPVRKGPVRLRTLRRRAGRLVLRDGVEPIGRSGRRGPRDPAGRADERGRGLLLQGGHEPGLPARRAALRRQGRRPARDVRRRRARSTWATRSATSRRSRPTRPAAARTRARASCTGCSAAPDVQRAFGAEIGGPGSRRSSGSSLVAANDASASRRVAVKVGAMRSSGPSPARASGTRRKPRAQARRRDRRRRGGRPRAPEARPDHGVGIALDAARARRRREGGLDDRVGIVERAPPLGRPENVGTSSGRRAHRGRRGPDRTGVDRRARGGARGRGPASSPPWCVPIRLSIRRIASSSTQVQQLPVDRHPELRRDLGGLRGADAHVEQAVERQPPPVDRDAPLGPQRLGGLGARPPVEELAQRVLLPADRRPEPPEGGGRVLPAHVLDVAPAERLRLGLRLGSERGAAGGARRIGGSPSAGRRRGARRRERPRPARSPAPGRRRWPTDTSRAP